jgi:hypothetical protein
MEKSCAALRPWIRDLERRSSIFDRQVFGKRLRVNLSITPSKRCTIGPVTKMMAWYIRQRFRFNDAMMSELDEKGMVKSIRSFMVPKMISSRKESVRGFQKNYCMHLVDVDEG